MVALEFIKRRNKLYIDNPKYVYSDLNHQYILILEKLEDTITNEQRDNVVDKNCAKFRGNKFRIARILDSHTSLNVKYVNIPNTRKIYQQNNPSDMIAVGEILYDPDFSLNDKSDTGFTYFFTIEAAYYSKCDLTCLTCKMETGEFIQYSDSGCVKKRYNLKMEFYMVNILNIMRMKERK